MPPQRPPVERFTEQGSRRITESGVPLVRIIDITAHEWQQADKLLEAAERQLSERADAWADELAAELDVEPDVIRPRLRTLHNDFYRLNEPKNDWMNEIQRAEAVEEKKAAFAEKLEDLSPAVKRSQGNRKRQAEIEARRVDLDALILAEVDAATAAVRGKWPDTTRLQGRIDYEIAAILKRNGVNGGKPVGLKRIRQARKKR